MIGLLIVLVAALLAAYTARSTTCIPAPTTLTCAPIVGIAPHVSGPITQLLVQDNQHVKPGELLLVIDPRPYQSVLDKAESDLALPNLQIGALQDAIRSASARVSQPQAEVAYDRQYLARIEPLLAKHFVTANDVFDARSRLEAGEAAVASAQSEVSPARNKLGQYGDINARRKAGGPRFTTRSSMSNTATSARRSTSTSPISTSPSASTATRATRCSTWSTTGPGMCWRTSGKIFSPTSGLA